MENQQILLYSIAVFTAVAAIALVVQACFLFGIYRAVRALLVRSSIFLDRWEPVADLSTKSIQELREQSNEALARVREVLNSIKEQAEKVDSIIDDVSGFSKTQLDRMDRTMEGAVHKLNDTTETVQKAVLIPVRQIRGLAFALGAVVDSLFGRRKPTVDRATLDEEMFI